MSCIETRCNSCGGVFMSNVIHRICPGCKQPGVSNSFDEQATYEDEMDNFEEDEL